MKQKVQGKVILFISLTACAVIIIFFYAINSALFWNKNVLWKDVNVSGLKLKDNGPEYNISKGTLYKGNESRKIKFDLNPFRLIENEKAVRLGLFYQVTKEDPLFIDPGFDAEAFSDSVQKLSEVNDKIKKSFGVETDVVPAGFLKKVGEISIKNNELENSKTYKNASSLVSLYKEANTLYKKSAISLKEKITDKNRTMVEISSVTSLDTIREDLDKIISNSAALEKEIGRREKCLNLSTLFCKRESLKEETLPNFQNGSQEVRILGKEDLYYTKDPKNMEIGIPYEIETSCFRTEEGENTHYLYAIKEDVEGGKRLIPKIATDNYYREMTNEGAEAVDLYYKKHGLTWRPMFVTTPYACNDLEYQPSLATVDYYSQNYKSSKIISDVLASGSIPEDRKMLFESARQLEETFANEKYPRYETVKQLAIAYHNIYVAIVNDQNSVDSEKWTKETLAIKDELLKRSLIGERKMAQLDQLISFFSYILDGYAETTPVLEFDNEYKKSYVYQVRSGYSLTYLGFSKSVWRGSDKLSYIIDTPRQMTPRIVNYDFMINTFGKDYVKNVTRFGRNDIWYEITGERIE